jgi:hypothetical protein
VDLRDALTGLDDHAINLVVAPPSMPRANEVTVDLRSMVITSSEKPASTVHSSTATATYSNKLRQAQTTGPNGPATGPLASRESLRADLANAHERNQRLQTRIQQLERRLSEDLGEQIWRERPRRRRRRQACPAAG